MILLILLILLLNNLYSETCLKQPGHKGKLSVTEIFKTVPRIQT